MSAVLWLHVAAGCFALLAGATAAAAGKGGVLHARAGKAFVGAMVLLGLTASILEPFRDPPGSPLAGLFVLYFVLTSWATARRRDGATGWAEAIGGLVAGALGLATGWGGLSGDTTPAGAAPVFILAGLLLLAAAGDWRAFALRRLAPIQRLTRHLWRMCVAFFIATGSFFLGQQQVMPAGVRGSPILVVLAVAPIVLMIVWLVRLRFGRALRRRFEALAPIASPVEMET